MNPSASLQRESANTCVCNVIAINLKPNNVPASYFQSLHFSSFFCNKIVCKRTSCNNGSTQHLRFQFGGTFVVQKRSEMRILSEPNNISAPMFWTCFRGQPVGETLLCQHRHGGQPTSTSDEALAHRRVPGLPPMEQRLGLGVPLAAHPERPL